MTSNTTSSITPTDELDTLTLTGLEVFAHHGVFDFERANGQIFLLDLVVWLDTAGAAAGDDLEQTLHYGELAIEVAEAVASEPVDLIETLAERVASLVLAHAVARRVRVTVHKPDAPIPCRSPTCRSRSPGHGTFARWRFSPSAATSERAARPSTALSPTSTASLA